MHLHRIDVLPVIDSDNNLRGEISCLKIFTYGIPDFFKQLETISFVRYLVPRPRGQSFVPRSAQERFVSGEKPQGQGPL